MSDYEAPSSTTNNEDYEVLSGFYDVPDQFPLQKNRITIYK
jgi:hypothetical protein